jgi:hypothetical protein
MVFFRDRGEMGAAAQKGAAIAQVIVLRANEFNTHDLHELLNRTPNQIRVQEQGSDPNFIYLIGTNDYDAFVFGPDH